MNTDKIIHVNIEKLIELADKHRSENKEMLEDIYLAWLALDAGNLDEIEQYLIKWVEVHEIIERYDCPIHGGGDGKDCPRC